MRLAKEPLKNNAEEALNLHIFKYACGGPGLMQYDS